METQSLSQVSRSSITNQRTALRSVLHRSIESIRLALNVQSGLIAIFWTLAFTQDWRAAAYAIAGLWMIAILERLADDVPGKQVITALLFALACWLSFHVDIEMMRVVPTLTTWAVVASFAMVAILDWFSNPLTQRASHQSSSSPFAKRAIETN